MRNFLLAIVAVCTLQSVIDAERRGNCNQFCLRHDNAYKMGMYDAKRKKCLCTDVYEYEDTQLPVFKLPSIKSPPKEELYDE